MTINLNNTRVMLRCYSDLNIQVRDLCSDTNNNNNNNNYYYYYYYYYYDDDDDDDHHHHHHHHYYYYYHQDDTTTTVTKMIQALPDKQCSTDPLPTWLLKTNVDLLAPFLCQLFNWSLEHGAIPSSMKPRT